MRLWRPLSASNPHIKYNNSPRHQKTCQACRSGIVPLGVLVKPRSAKIQMRQRRKAAREAANLIAAMTTLDKTAGRAILRAIAYWIKTRIFRQRRIA